MLESNDATASSLLFRRAVAAPIPDAVPYTDWWFAARAAERSEIAYVPEPRTLYRFHGGNLTLGTEGPRREREMRKAIALRLWFLRRLDSLSAVSCPWSGGRSRSTPPRGARLGPIRRATRTGRRRAPQLAAGEALLRRGEPEAAAARLSRALAWDRSRRTPARRWSPRSPPRPAARPTRARSRCAAPPRGSCWPGPTSCWPARRCSPAT